MTVSRWDNWREKTLNINFQPSNPGPNCTLTLTEGQEIISSSCDTGDEIYEDQCRVTIQCENGTYPMTNTYSQTRDCVKGEWVDPVTKGPLQPYPCNGSCKDISTVTRNPRSTSQPFGNTTVTCSRVFIEAVRCRIYSDIHYGAGNGQICLWQREHRSN